MPKVDLENAELVTGSLYPEMHRAEMAGRSSLRFSDAAGLSKFGVNITILQPGAKSSLRHWHVEQDEFVYVLEGTATLVDDHGETEIAAGECAAFPAGDENGHQIINKSDAEVRMLVMANRTVTETAYYSDLDMKVVLDETGQRFVRKDGSPYPGGEND